MRWSHALCMVALAGALFWGTTPVRSQDEGEGGGVKNVKFLTGKSRKEVKAIMKTWTQALGVKCEHCHVQDFAADDKQEKKTAREMLQMSIQMNRDFPQMKKAGTCWLCHRGQKEPPKPTTGEKAY